jgi:ABC-type polysaccharide/polyol phosphate export permease
MLETLWRYRHYVWGGAWNELRYRHAGTGAGIFWNLGNPLLQAAVYVTVFPFLRQQGGAYATYLLAGLFPWQAFSEAVVRGSQALGQNAGMLRSLPVPGEAFIVQSALTSLATMQITLLLLMPIAWFAGHAPAWAWLWLPVIGTALIALGFGLSLALAHLRVLLPDVGEVLRFFMQMWMWSMPIIYPVAMAQRAGIEPWLPLNPPYVFLRSLREALIEGHGPNAGTLLVMGAWTALALLGGALVTRLLRREARDWL